MKKKSIVYQVDQPIQWAELSKYYAGMHAAGSVHWNAFYRAWFVVGYDEVKKGLKLASLSSEVGSILEASIFPRTWVEKAKPLQEYFSHWMLFASKKRHAQLRQAVTPFFQTSHIKNCGERWENTAEALLIAQTEGCDLVCNVIRPYVVQSLLATLGYSVDHTEAISRWSYQLSQYINASVCTPKIITEALQAVEEQRIYYSNKRDSPIAKHLIEEGMFSEDEIWITQAMLLSAGVETASSLISATVFSFCQDSNLHRVSSAKDFSHRIAEALRYYPPAHSVLRLATEDFVLGGTQVRSGDALCFVLGAANRDPAVFPDPAQFDVTREGTIPLSFGMGPHYCIGRHLGEAMARIFLKVFSRYAGSFNQRSMETEWYSGVAFQGFHRLVFPQFQA